MDTGAGLGVEASCHGGMLGLGSGGVLPASEPIPPEGDEEEGEKGSEVDVGRFGGPDRVRRRVLSDLSSC